LVSDLSSFTRLTVMICALAPSAALADPVYCSTSFQGYRVCSSPDGYTSTEWSRDGLRFGQDSDGNRWTTSRWAR
jgi:hypothetical protein